MSALFAFFLGIIIGAVVSALVLLSVIEKRRRPSKKYEFKKHETHRMDKVSGDENILQRDKTDRAVKEFDIEQ